jgi:hypothetical protein
MIFRAAGWLAALAMLGAGVFLLTLGMTMAEVHR